jgi:LemA protein
MVYVVLAVVVVVGLFCLSIYNSLISLRHQLQRSWANIDVILKQRYDELPQLIQVIEQLVGYEAGILKDLAEARTRYGSAHSVGEKIDAAGGLSVALRGVAALGEAYPQLKSNENFNQLQSRISSLENTLADRRETYNETVANFNIRIEQFPDALVARILNYKGQQMFQVSEVERQAPSLKMNLPKFGKGA